jgi:hypothetical protein
MWELMPVTHSGSVQQFWAWWRYANLVLEPGRERTNQWFALIWRTRRRSSGLAPRIVFSIASSACDRRIGTLGDVAEPAAQARPAERERLARLGSNLLEARSPSHCTMRPTALEQLKPVDRASPGSVSEGNRRRISPSPGRRPASEAAPPALQDRLAADRYSRSPPHGIRFAHRMRRDLQPNRHDVAVGRGMSGAWSRAHPSRPRARRTARPRAASHHY